MANSYLLSATGDLVLTAEGNPILTLLQVQILAATVDVRVTAQLVAYLTTTPLPGSYVFSLLSGTLPPCFTLSAAGVLTGVGFRVQDWPIRIRAQGPEAFPFDSDYIIRVTA